MKLWFVVHGDGSMFAISIAQNADVNAVKEAIFCSQRYDLRSDFPPSSLSLYLTRDGNGLSMEDFQEAARLQRGNLASKYVEMNPMLDLDDALYFDPGFKPGRHVHVLVELPTEGSTGTHCVECIHT